MDSDGLKTLGKKLRQRREAFGMGTIEAAERSGVSHSYISRLERGLVPGPKLSELDGVARGYGYASLGAMLMEAEPRHPKEGPEIAMTELERRMARVTKQWGGASTDAQLMTLDILDAIANRLAGVGPFWRGYEVVLSADGKIVDPVEHEHTRQD